MAWQSYADNVKAYDKVTHAFITDLEGNVWGSTAVCSLLLNETLLIVLNKIINFTNHLCYDYYNFSCTLDIFLIFVNFQWCYYLKSVMIIFYFAIGFFLKSYIMLLLISIPVKYRVSLLAQLNSRQQLTSWNLESQVQSLLVVSNTWAFE